MPFCPCYRRVGRLPDPDLCWSCVGCSRPRSAVAPGPRTRPCHTRTRAGPRRSTSAFFHPMPAAARRPATASYRWPADHPRYPSAGPEMTHRDEQSMRGRIKSAHIADYARVVYRLTRWSPTAICAGYVRGWLHAAGRENGRRLRLAGWRIPARRIDRGVPASFLTVTARAGRGSHLSACPLGPDARVGRDGTRAEHSGAGD